MGLKPLAGGPLERSWSYGECQGKVKADLDVLPAVAVKDRQQEGMEGWLSEDNTLHHMSGRGVAARDGSAASLPSFPNVFSLNFSLMF